MSDFLAGGQWFSFNFGWPMRLQGPEPVDPSDVPRKGNADEWQIEVLFALNLDVLMPAFELSPLEFSTANTEWGAVDLEAIDIAGDRHFFEMKKEGNRDAKDALGQVVGYAMRSLVRGDHLEVALAPAPGDLLRSVHRVLRSENAPVPPIADFIAGHESRLLATRARLKGKGSMVHLHVVAPNVDRESTVQLAKKLIHHGHIPVWLWDVRATLPSGDGQDGRFFVRRVDVEFGGAPSADAFRPLRVRARLAAADSVHASKNWRFQSAVDNVAGAYCPEDLLMARVQGNAAHVRLTAWRPLGWTPEQDDIESQLMGRCLTALAPAPAGKRRSIDSGTGGPVEWDAVVAGVPVVLRRCGGKITNALINFPTNAPDDDVARVLDLWMHAIDKLLGEYPQAFRR